MAQKPNNRSNNNNNTTYTPSRFSSYDNMFSSLSWTWANDNAMLNIAPIEPNMIGKTPKRGEKVYDYDNRLSFFVSPAMAKAFIRAIAELREIVDNAEDDNFAYDRVTVEDVGGEAYRSLTLIRPNGIAVKVSGKTTKFDGYVLQGRASKGGEDEESFFHMFPNNSIKFIKRESASNIEELEVVHESDLEIFLEFLQAVVDNAVALSAHTAQRVIRNIGNTGGGASNKRRPFANIAEEYDGSDGDEEDEDEEASQPKQRKTATRKPVGKSPAKSSRRGALDEEFGEEDYDEDIPM